MAGSGGGGGDGVAEISNDGGFVFKRLKPQELPSVPAAGAVEAEAELHRRRRRRRRDCLLRIGERYRRELQQWESLDASASAPLPPPQLPPAASAAALPDFRADGGPQEDLIDELIAQAEAQEAMLKKISEMCDLIDALCQEKEESLVAELAELPIWGSPRSLMQALCQEEEGSLVPELAELPWGSPRSLMQALSDE